MLRLAAARKCVNGPGRLSRFFPCVQKPSRAAAGRAGFGFGWRSPASPGTRLGSDISLALVKVVEGPAADIVRARAFALQRPLRQCLGAAPEEQRGVFAVE